MRPRTHHQREEVRPRPDDGPHARQTAQIVATETGAELRVEPLLAPGAGVQELRRAIADVTGPVAAVGHQPDCSEIAIELTGDDPGFPTGGVAELELEDQASP